MNEDTTDAGRSGPRYPRPAWVEKRTEQESAETGECGRCGARVPLTRAARPWLRAHRPGGWLVVKRGEERCPGVEPRDVRAVDAGA